MPLTFSRLNIFIIIFVLALSLTLNRRSLAGTDPEIKIFKFTNKIVAQVEKDVEAGGDKIVFFKNGKKTACEFTEEPIRSFFHSVTEVKVDGYANPLYISNWSLGAHGEKFNVFDPSLGENCSLTQIEWGHPMTYAVEGDHFVFTKFGSGVERWKPEGSTKALAKEFPASSPSDPHNP